MVETNELPRKEGGVSDADVAFRLGGVPPRLDAGQSLGHIGLRDGELERVLKRQNTRFTTLLTVAIVLSISALTAVSTFGYLAYEAMFKIK